MTQSSEEQEPKDTDYRTLMAFAIIVATNAMSIAMGVYFGGETPDPVEITCDIAAEVAASAECKVEETVPLVEQQTEDEAAIEAEEEAAENQPIETE